MTRNVTESKQDNPPFDYSTDRCVEEEERVRTLTITAAILFFSGTFRNSPQSSMMN